jgi:hypothetical protein
MKTQHCDECVHWTLETPPNDLANMAKGIVICKKLHKPRFYAPKGIMDLKYGYKRKCDDFQNS